MVETTYTLHLPASIKQTVEAMAKVDGVSVEHWIAMTIAHRIGAQMNVADYFKLRAGDARPSDLLPFLDRAPSGPTIPGDELPENYVPRNRSKPAAE